MARSRFRAMIDFGMRLARMTHWSGVSALPLRLLLPRLSAWPMSEKSIDRIEVFSTLPSSPPRLPR